MTEPVTTPTTNRQKTIIAFLILLAIAVVIGLIAKPSSKAALDTSVGEAKWACHTFVEHRLVSPSTAHFTAETVTGDAISGYTDNGTVDADNSYGAPIRAQFTCTISSVAGNWRLDSLTGL